MTKARRRITPSGLFALREQMRFGGGALDFDPFRPALQRFAGQGRFDDGAPETARSSGDEEDMRHDSDRSLLTGGFS